ncbi:hypothetical protein ESZ53_09035 [Salinibacterium sp. UTAS2018]|uniref:hypothetical protein n=1 Tax=unclassified Salinibacterium TaxID=2632331 RepID=UPI001009662B|nr:MULTISPECIES: hypothetical protein [unclassified Salinibacterium]MBH0008105.1 hypothetical protein [Salinibacterium sp. SWN1162]QAV70570.1 hypothetical protein ESZ53_09035 [Salinibacterium sp. UTAS2018]
MDALQSPKKGVASSPIRRSVAIAGTVLVALTLGGCTPATPDGGAPLPSEPAATSEPEPTSAPEPEAEALTIPECDALYPIADARALWGDNTELYFEGDATDVGHYTSEPIAAIDTLGANATMGRTCLWGIPNSGAIFGLTVADVTPADADLLTAALIGEGYFSFESRGATSLMLEAEGPIAPSGRTHYLIDDLWVYAGGTRFSVSVPVANAALEQVRAANPTREY